MNSDKIVHFCTTSEFFIGDYWSRQRTLRPTSDFPVADVYVMVFGVLQMNDLQVFEDSNKFNILYKSSPIVNKHHYNQKRGVAVVFTIKKE